ncbi:sugar ABC transporter ATP-binding protein [Actinomadura sp. SCN-SB]|uniref:sugar ABC transporter ATP-binding protein n=1 Tax=Actinomadura sp. SCN-SB TaxID=3373092 RepID=UPI003750DC56
MTAEATEATTARPSLLTATGIRKSFAGVPVLHGVDVSVRPGEVLALLGENGAGKSTLVKILAGDHRPDGGTISLGGVSVPALDPKRARALGIRMIFQEPADAPSLSVAENVFLGRWPTTAGRVDWAAMRSRAARILAELDADLDPRATVGALRIGERQIVEIARALTDDARVLILDEPTAALSSEEVARLFRFVRRLRDRGVGIIYITHRLDEVRELADRVQVLRDGRTALSAPVGSVGRDELVSAMIGRSAGTVARPAAAAPAHEGAEPVLRFTEASIDGVFTDVSLSVAPGEVVALYGKVGSGIAEVAETAFGLRTLTSGTVEVDGRARSFRDPAAAIRAGVGLLPADRQRDGGFAVRPVAENLAAPSWPLMSRLGVLTSRREDAAYGRWREALRIRAGRGPRQPIATLSGGNQQKVLLGRWLERGSKLLILIEPTRGVDVGARQEIYTALRELVTGRAGLLVATSDYEEVVQLADRALVMARGRVVAELGGDDVTTRALTDAAGG